MLQKYMLSDQRIDKQAFRIRTLDTELWVQPI